ncbi:benenodin family lasso peptide [Sphingomonas sp.]|jgi:hypothetical protein|nr:benenodin family lasso peptide [Sphingomonas sp.]MBO9712501.1 benenodin family lasso peptide [Sphingomonas sp.]
MERTVEHEPIIDLGAASTETKGNAGEFKDDQSTRMLPGLSDE